MSQKLHLKIENDVFPRFSQHPICVIHVRTNKSKEQHTNERKETNESTSIQSDKKKGQTNDGIANKAAPHRQSHREARADKTA